MRSLGYPEEVRAQLRRETAAELAETGQKSPTESSVTGVVPQEAKPQVESALTALGGSASSSRSQMLRKLTGWPWSCSESGAFAGCGS